METEVPVKQSCYSTTKVQPKWSASQDGRPRRKVTPFQWQVKETNYAVQVRSRSYETTNIDRAHTVPIESPVLQARTSHRQRSSVRSTAEIKIHGPPRMHRDSTGIRRVSPMTRFVQMRHAPRHARIETNHERQSRRSTQPRPHQKACRRTKLGETNSNRLPRTSPLTQTTHNQPCRN